MNSTFANLDGHRKMEAATRQRLEMHPKDAEARGIADGDAVRVWNDRGTLMLTALVNGSVPAGVVAGHMDWAKMHPEGGNQNVLTSERLTDLGAAATFYSVLVEVDKRRGSAGRLRAMNWTSILIAFAVLVVLFLLRRMGQVSSKDALEHLRNGALVIDVRTPGEFNSGHLPGAINLPLDEIETSLPRRVKDKNQVLLLHCQSGMRSGVAKKKLKGMGYANAFNLGSYGQAAKIVSAK